MFRLLGTLAFLSQWNYFIWLNICTQILTVNVHDTVLCEAS